MNQTDSQTGSPTDGTGWIVGIDGSGAAAHALDWAAVHAPGRTTRLQLVTSWQAPISGPTMEGIPSGSPIFDRELLVTSAQCVVDAAAAGIAPLGDITIEPTVAHGGPSAVLLDAAEHAALLVVGTRGRGGFQRLLLGSTSTQCATHGSRPIAVVPQGAGIESANHFTVGFDSSDNSIAGLEWALTFARPGAHIEVLSIWDTSPIAVGTDQFFFPDATDLAEERFHHLVDHVVAKHAETIAANTTGDVTIERTFVPGTPRRVLAERSESTDLLVLGARGHGAIGSALMGSVSTWTLHHTHASTVIVPATAH